MDKPFYITGSGLVDFLLVFPLFYITYQVFQKFGELIYQYEIFDEYIKITRYFFISVRKIHVSDVKKYSFEKANSIFLKNVVPQGDFYLSNTRRDFLILDLKSQKLSVIISPKKSNKLTSFLIKVQKV